MKVAINSDYGGFSLSKAANVEYMKRKYGTFYAYKMHIDKGWKISLDVAVDEDDDDFVYLSQYDLGDTFNVDEVHKKYNYERIFLEDSDPNLSFRSDPVLISVIEDLGEKANGQCASIRIIEIPDDVNAIITEYDGFESVEEVHRSWS